MNKNPTKLISISLTEQEFRNIELAKCFKSHFDVTESELHFFNEYYEEGTNVRFTNQDNKLINGIITKRDCPQKIYNLYRVSYSVRLTSTH